VAAIFGPYSGLVRDVHDGDTAYIDLDLGFGVFFESRDWDNRPRLACRVYGINAPELWTDAGKQALAYAQTLLPVGTRVQVTSHDWDKYGGRFDGTITLPDGRDFAQAMLDAGQAVPYFP
jgi:endonuclease YncB( thermonuclease family)